MPDQEPTHSIQPLQDARYPVVVEPIPASQVVAAAGTALVTAARAGRALSRTGWGLARRLPGGRLIEREVQRLQDAAISEVRRILDVAPVAAGGAQHLATGLISSEEQRAVALIQNHQPGEEPLRSAMNELLERSVETDRGASRDYLFGTIISQLVPDEARILAALSDGTPYAAVDVLARHRGRGRGRVVLENASTVGRAAGVVTPDKVPTYVSRLLRFGLVELGPPRPEVEIQFDILATEDVVRAAEESIEAGHLGAPRLVRKSLAISPLGREFWAASDPSRPAQSNGTH